MIPAAALTKLTKLAALGLTDEQSALVVALMADVESATKAEAETVVEAGREKARARMAKWRETHKGDVVERHVTSRDDTQRLTGEGAHVEDKTSNLEIEPQQEERNALTREFVDFWTAYPNKVGKPKAFGAFTAARKRASLAAILAGLGRYVASKPADRAWLNPATFLNQDRWGDQPADAPVARAGPAGRPITAQEILKQQREGFANHDEPTPNRPYLAFAG